MSTIRVSEPRADPVLLLAFPSVSGGKGQPSSSVAGGGFSEMSRLVMRSVESAEEYELWAANGSVLKA